MLDAMEHVTQDLVSRGTSALLTRLFLTTILIFLSTTIVGHIISLGGCKRLYHEQLFSFISEEIPKALSIANSLPLRASDFSNILFFIVATFSK